MAVKTKDYYNKANRTATKLWLRRIELAAPKEVEVKPFLDDQLIQGEVESHGKYDGLTSYAQARRVKFDFDQANVIIGFKCIIRPRDTDDGIVYDLRSIEVDNAPMRMSEVLRNCIEAEEYGCDTSELNNMSPDSDDREWVCKW